MLCCVGTQARPDGGGGFAWYHSSLYWPRLRVATMISLPRLRRLPNRYVGENVYFEMDGSFLEGGTSLKVSLLTKCASARLTAATQRSALTVSKARCWTIILTWASRSWCWVIGRRSFIPLVTSLQSTTTACARSSFSWLDTRMAPSQIWTPNASTLRMKMQTLKKGLSD